MALKRIKLLRSGFVPKVGVWVFFFQVADKWNKIKFCHQLASNSQSVVFFCEVTKGSLIEISYLLNESFLVGFMASLGL